MPCIDSPTHRPVQLVAITRTPLSGAVDDGQVVMFVRNVGAEIQISVQLYILDRENAATISLPTLTRAAALSLAGVLVETVTGQPLPQATWTEDGSQPG